ncbi:MAG: histidine kinase [Acidimicrobiia bacterium]|nr:histidine kinase [Acidimicrobiia bacterium]
MRWAPAAVAGAVIMAGVLAVSVRGESPVGLLPLFSAGLLFVVAGAVASGRRPDSQTGRLLTATGFAWLLGQTLLVVPNALAATVGLALLPLSLAVLAHLALAFPNGLESRAERLIAAVPYALVLVGVPVMDFGDCPESECPRNVVGLDVDRGLGRLWYATLLIGAALTGVCMLVVLVRRWRRASVPARRVLLPVVPGACLFIVVYIVALLSELGLPTGLGTRWAQGALLLLGVAPVVFLGGSLRARLARAQVGRLVVELGDVSAEGALRDAVARALGDPTVILAYAVAESGGYVDGHGRPVELPSGGGAQVVTLIERASTPVGALIHDAALRDDQAHVDAVCAAAGLALENERLHAEVLVRLAEVRASRARIVEAADAARRRVERNLHDGAQQRLVNLSLAVGMARSKLGSEHEDVKDILGQASEEAAAAIRELRELARGLHPSILNEAGLVAAVESAAERSPVPVDVRASVDGALPASVEAAAYYVVAESLANAGKHAQASSVRVCIDHHGNRLRVEVADDGVGGAELRPGSGLEGLADRLAALDGCLEVHSAPESGTRVRAELPCG